MVAAMTEQDVCQDGVAARDTARRSAGQVCPSGEDAGWLLADLAAALSGVQVLSVYAAPQLLPDADPGRGPDGLCRWAVGGVAVDVHIAEHADAVRVAAMFPLAPSARSGESGGRVWSRWTGWVVDAGRDFPLSLTVTALRS